MKNLCVILLAAFILLISAPAQAIHEYAPGIDKDTGAADIVIDVLITRPIGFLGLIGGSVAYVLTLPASKATDSVERAKLHFITEPYKYTFERPLGDIRGERHY